ncbi:MAG: hypothetical protein LBU28_08055, partial [Spirochaetaceae bacterium]|nr:hypothetical protein [Spirochaetaceae bacterium]
MNIQEIQEELLKQEYPFLTPDYDPDIERYFNLRNSGRAADALYLYQTRLKPRYPDDDFRAVLMRSYRSRDPLYKRLQVLAYRGLGERSLNRIRRIIAYIAEKARSYDERDVYSTIKAADAILAGLPPGRYEAIAGLERYLRYAQALDFHVRPLSKALELIRSYLTQSLAVVEEELGRRQNRRQEELARKQRQMFRARGEAAPDPGAAPQSPLINLSQITFSPEDLARIEIPRNLSSPEDQTLAYCVKYWNLVNDTAFEQILYLYSKKYGARHHNVFLIIRRGRLNMLRDDEILASVMSSLVTGYYYSIKGDKYLQRNWNIIKLSMQQPSAGENRHAAAPPRPRRGRTAQGPRLTGSAARTRSSGPKSPALPRPSRPPKTPVEITPVLKPAPKPARAAKPPVEPAVTPPPTPARAAKPPGEPAVTPPPAPARAAKSPDGAAVTLPPKPARAAKPPAEPAVTPPPKPAEPADTVPRKPGRAAKSPADAADTAPAAP